MIGLTLRQQEALQFIATFVAAHGHSPSYRQIQDGLGLHSTGNVHQLVTQLERRGAIKPRPKKAHRAVVPA